MQIVDVEMLVVGGGVEALESTVSRQLEVVDNAIAIRVFFGVIA